MAALPVAGTTILIEHERAALKRGRERSILLSELTELARHHHIEIGCIHAWTTSTGFRLAFFGIPTELHQRFRNVWGVHWR